MANELEADQGKHPLHTSARGVNQMTFAAPTITVALDMSKPFNIVNIRKLTRKILYTHSKDHYQIRIELHQKTQRIHNIQRTHINTTLIFISHVVVRLSVHVHFNIGLSPRDS